MDEDLTQEELDYLKNLREEELEDSEEDRILTSQELGEGYGPPLPEERHNQHEFLSKSTDKLHVDRFTFLDEEELGRPLFNVRFLMKLEALSKHYLDKICEANGVENRISEYFRREIDNICSSGMSKNGFIQMMNVTKKVDTTRTRRRDNIENLKGGSKK